MKNCAGLLPAGYCRAGLGKNSGGRQGSQQMRNAIHKIRSCAWLLTAAAAAMGLLAAAPVLAQDLRVQPVARGLIPAHAVKLGKEPDVLVDREIVANQRDGNGPDLHGDQLTIGGIVFFDVPGVERVTFA